MSETPEKVTDQESQTILQIPLSEISTDDTKSMNGQRPATLSLKENPASNTSFSNAESTPKPEISGASATERRETSIPRTENSADSDVRSNPTHNKLSRRQNDGVLSRMEPLAPNTSFSNVESTPKPEISGASATERRETSIPRTENSAGSDVRLNSNKSITENARAETNLTSQEAPAARGQSNRNNEQHIHYPGPVIIILGPICIAILFATIYYLVKWQVD